NDGEARSIAYTGMRVGSMAHTFNYGEVVNAVYGFGGNGYSVPPAPITDGRVIDPASDDQSFDASNGLTTFILDGKVLNVLPDVCVEALDYTLNNNLQPQTCVGELSPSDQVAFSAAIEVNVRMYNGISGFDTVMPKKISQDPVGLHWAVIDSDGNGYGFSMPRVQLNFPDPAATGRNEFVFLEGAGVASFDAAMGSTLRIYEIIAPVAP
ncbi:MAG: hypothetical protein DRI46_12740, partial [Chloroflexi bacterium]